MRVLLIEDCDEDVALVKRRLDRARFGDYRVHAVPAWEQAQPALQSQDWDVILLDMSLPDLSGEAGVVAVNEAAPGVPVVVMTGRDDHELALRTLELGAQDYLVKGASSDDALERALRYAVQRQETLDELERTRQQQVRLRDEFLSHVSHELRTPLTAIAQFVGVILDGLAGDLTDEQREYLGIAARNVDQLKGMIADLMEVSRAQSGKLRIQRQPVELDALVEESASVLRSKAADREIDIRVESAGDLPITHADPSRVRQVLGNLLENAIKFSPEGSRVVVSVDHEVETGIRVSVADQGCGMDAATQERVFDRLEQVEAGEWKSRKGLGLGLYICKEIVELHGGRLWVESQPQLGSTFRFTLPDLDLGTLIRPALFEDDRLRETFAVIRVTLSSLHLGTSVQIPGYLCEEIEGALQGAIFSRFDVLLPRLSTIGLDESFLITARTDGPGAEAMRARLQGVMDDLDLARMNLRAAVDAHARSIRSDGPGSGEAGVREAAAHVAALMVGRS